MPIKNFKQNKQQNLILNIENVLTYFKNTWKNKD